LPVNCRCEEVERARRLGGTGERDLGVGEGAADLIPAGDILFGFFGPQQLQLADGQTDGSVAEDLRLGADGDGEAIEGDEKLNIFDIVLGSRLDLRCFDGAGGVADVGLAGDEAPEPPDVPLTATVTLMSGRTFLNSSAIALVTGATVLEPSARMFLESLGAPGCPRADRTTEPTTNTATNAARLTRDALNFIFSSF
jgi:hypothetical protein